ncbi:sensor histidine kinase [Herbinix luporum]|uniref:Oxygen sensor histidine kinase NreB n=1 Tax=Herbinix luporum TaxID=1679721 RepID=A0A0K8J8W3_9FIRM|nr:sensor histidine kinase [Herbinix luporum]CUH93929.1 hypothetical protein SD1D_2419 [Herbinix luporum]
MYDSDIFLEDTDKLKNFVSGLIKEYENNLKLVKDKRKSYLNKLSEKEAASFLCISNKDSLLFPTSYKGINIEELKLEIAEIEEDINRLTHKEESLKYDIMQFKRIRAFLEEKKQLYCNSDHKYLKIQEQDRQRIARDLHDSTIQILSSLIHKIELCTRLVDMDPVRTRLELITMTNTIKEVIGEIREIIYNLNPMSLEDLGLITTVERFINQLMMNHDIKVSFNYNEEKKDILGIVNLSIFRIIQEACNNAIKHAEAKSIEINIFYNEKYINISVKDDGKGFDTELKQNIKNDNYTGYGLSFMKERVNLLSGKINIESNINKGTIVTVKVPITISEGEE